MKSLIFVVMGLIFVVMCLSVYVCRNRNSEMIILLDI